MICYLLPEQGNAVFDWEMLVQQHPHTRRIVRSQLDLGEGQETFKVHLS